MGITINMVSGNGSKVVAFLIANYPSGAICTATCDGKTLTGSGNTQSAFAIPFFGTWRVTITDQGQSAFEDVVVSDNLQYTVTLIFWDGTLYDGGDEYTAVTGGWDAIAGTVTKDATYIDLYYSSSKNGTASTHEPIDVTDFSTLHVIVTTTATYDSYAGLATTYGVYAPADIEYKVKVTGAGSTQKEYTLDISGVTGNYYATVTTRGSGNHLRMFKMWLT